MMLAFVLIAGSLAAGAAVLLLLPLVRRRADARPAAGFRRRRCCRDVVRRRRPVCGLQQLLLGGFAAPVGDTPAARAARLAQELARPARRPRWMAELGRIYMELEQYPARGARLSARRSHLPMSRTPRPSWAWPKRCWPRTSHSSQVPRARMFERALELRAEQSEGAALQRVRRAWGAARLPVARNASSACWP